MIDAVFDTNVFLQAAVNIHGPAFACWEFAELGRIRVFITSSIIEELTEVLTRPKIRRQFPVITAKNIDNIIETFLAFSYVVEEPPSAFELPRDISDAKFINLAIANKASHIVSRDNDLLDLPNDTLFSSKFSTLQIVDPVEFLKAVRAK